MAHAQDPTPEFGLRRPAFPPPPDERQGAIVLVHGAWVGEYCWNPVLPLLRASGRPVHAVSLTGHGMRAHQNGPAITLQDHIADVVAVIVGFDLTAVTLVGHSYGGRVISGVWSAVGDRIEQLIYLDAHAPTLDEHVSPDAGLGGGIGTVLDNGMVPFDHYPPDEHEFGGPESVAWFVERAVPQSASTIQTMPVTELPDELDKTFVHATADEDSRFAAYADAARRSPSWRVIDVPASHWLMVSHPEEVASIILDPRHSAGTTTQTDSPPPPDTRSSR